MNNAEDRADDTLRGQRRPSEITQQTTISFHFRSSLVNGGGEILEYPPRDAPTPAARAEDTHNQKRPQTPLIPEEPEQR